MRVRLIKLLLVVTVVGAGLLLPAPPAVSAPGGGCQFATDSLGTSDPAYRLVPGKVWMDYHSPNGGVTNYLRAWITVDSLPAVPAPPAGSLSGSWQVSYTNATYFQNDSAANVFWRGFLKATVLPTGDVRFEAGNSGAGSAEVTVATGKLHPGTPGVIEIQANANQLGMNPDGFHGAGDYYRTKHYTTLFSATTSANTLPTVLHGAQETLLDRSPAGYPSQEEMTLRVNPAGCDAVPAVAQSRALSARAFIDSVGVNTHLVNYPSSYRSKLPTTPNYPVPGDELAYPEIEAALLDLNIHHIRDVLPGQPEGEGRLPDPGVEIAEFVKLAGSPWDVKTQVVFRTADFGGTSGQPTVGPAPGINSALVKHLESLADAGGISAFEGINEPDLGGGTTANAEVSADQRAISWLRDSSSKFTGVGLVGPSYVSDAGADSMAASDPDLGDYVDHASSHPYSPYLTGRPHRDFQMAYFEQLARRVYGGATRPIRVTELGWSNTTLVPPPGAGNGGVSPRTAAAYLPKALLLNFGRGIDRTFIYQLADDVGCSTHTTDPVSTTPSPVAYGLLECDRTPKPSYHTVRNLMNLLRDTGPSFTPTPLSYGISGDRIQNVVVQKSDGTFWLALWQDVELYDYHWVNGNTVPYGDLHPPAATATVTFPAARGAHAYAVSQGTSAIATIAPGTSHSITVPSDDVVLLELTAEAPSSRREAAQRRRCSAERRRGCDAPG